MYLFINVADRQWRPGVRRILTELTEEEQRDFLQFLCREFVTLVRRVIDTQRWRHRWPKLSKEYEEMKHRKGLFPGIWKATGVLEKAVKFWKVPKGWVIGIHKNAKYRRIGGSVRVYDVARWLEKGTTKMPPRPLFTPIAAYMRRHIADFYRRWEKQRI